MDEYIAAEIAYNKGVKNFISDLTKILKVDIAHSYTQNSYTLNMVDYARLLHKYDQPINEEWFNQQSEEIRKYILNLGDNN